jgi:hypothetical protein
MLKEGYDHFNATHREPKVAVCDKRYVFDAADDSGRPLSFNPKGACPAYQLDKNIADAVLDQRRQEQYKMAEYIASGVSTAPSRAGVDGGMNPVFVAKLSPQSGFDNNGRSYQVASASTAPGALPRVENAPGALPRNTTPTPPAAAAEAPVRSEPARKSSEPVAVASVPMPRSAPQPKQGEAPASEPKPTTIAGLIGSWFGGSKDEAPAPPAKEQAVVRGASTDLAAKPKQAAPVRAVSATTPVHASTAAAPAPNPREAAPKPTETVRAPAPPAPTPPVQSAKAEPPQQPEIRTAYSTPPARNNGLLSGAQPVVPVGTFNSFR